jgi:hypothetical protein
MNLVQTTRCCSRAGLLVFCYILSSLETLVSLTTSKKWVLPKLGFRVLELGFKVYAVIIQLAYVVDQHPKRLNIWSGFLLPVPPALTVSSQIGFAGGVLVQCTSSCSSFRHDFGVVIFGHNCVFVRAFFHWVAALWMVQLLCISIEFSSSRCSWRGWQGSFPLKSR